ncbi:hypothetical protein C8F04DRAFT_241895 [Mycena alexandri]|uniref:Uncharacterized protein n=1 Tax=Mycena alexandri TaxID=1745969 RepID=A0AAD6SB99_9AGAR|nr:hypothetical protein C8F04DRAFT_241895 [Mycena alexandri]
MRGRVVELATNCYEYHVLQKALNCKEQEVCMLIVSELLRGVSATTLVNNEASHMWSKATSLVDYGALVDPIATADLRVAAYLSRASKPRLHVMRLERSSCRRLISLARLQEPRSRGESIKPGIFNELLRRASRYPASKESEFRA